MSGRIADISEVLLHLGLSSSVTEEERAITQEAIRYAEGAVRKHLRYDPVQASRTEFYPSMDFSLQSRAAVWEVTDTEAYLRRLNDSAVDELQLQHLPIRSITSVHVDYDGRAGAKSGAFPNPAQTEGTDFWPNYDKLDDDGNKMCHDGVLRSEGRWPNVPGSVKVVYTAGYSDAELHGNKTIVDASPILEAVIDEAVRRVQRIYSKMKKARTGFTGPFSSESLGDYSYSVDTALLQRMVGGLDLMPETVEKLSEFVNWGWNLAS